MATLKEKSQDILDEKNAKILPENIREGVQVFNVVGTMQEGIDTSDANASATDIANGKTAYVNGEKITGSIEEITDMIGQPADNIHITGNEPESQVDIRYNFPSDVLYRQDASLLLFTNNEALANAAQLTPEKLVAGNTVLGIAGTAEIGQASGGVKTYSSYAEMEADTSIEDGTVCVIEIYKELSGNLYDVGVGKKVKIPTSITMSKLNMSSSYSSTYASDDDMDRLSFSKGALSTAFYIKAEINGDQVASIKYTYNTDLGAYTTTTISEPMEVEFTNYISQKSFTMELIGAVSSVEVFSSVNYIENIYKYENNEFVLLDAHNTTVAHITNDLDNMPEGKFDGEFALAHRSDTTTSIEPNTSYPVVTFKEKINKSEIAEGTYTYNHMQYEENIYGSVEQKITIEVGSDSIKATCTGYTNGTLITETFINEVFAGIGLVNVDVEYILNTETNEYEIQNQTNWLFGNGEEIDFSILGTCELKPLNISTDDWQDIFKILCNGMCELYGIYQFDQTTQHYHRVNYGFNAEASDVLEGKVAFSDGMITGTMPNNGRLKFTPSTQVQTIPTGYTSGGFVEGSAALVPENIKDGTSIFGVKGNMKHSVEGNFKWMKSFNTIADAEASNDIGYDEKVFIYGGIPVQIEQEAQVTSIYLPKTIVLPSAVTKSINVKQEIVSDHSSGGGSNNLTPTEFMIDFSLNMNMLMVRYTSTDGITYRRADLKMYNETTWSDMWDMVDDVAYIKPADEYSENYKFWYKVNSTDETEISLAKEFFKQLDYTYGGMLQNVGTVTENKAQGFRNLRVNRNNSTDRADYTIDHEIDWCVDVIKARKVVNAVKTAIGSDYTFFKVKVVDDNTYIAFGHSYISSEKIRIEPLVNMSFADIDGDLRFHLGYSWNTASTTQDNGIIIYKGVIGEDGNATVTNVTNEYTIKTMELGERTYKYIEDFLEDNVTYSNVYYGTDVTFEVENMIFNNEPYTGYSSWYFFQGAGKTFTLQPVDLTQ